jgi:transcription elongation factor Elf1
LVAGNVLIILKEMIFMDVDRRYYKCLTCGVVTSLDKNFYLTSMICKTCKGHLLMLEKI